LAEARALPHLDRLPLVSPLEVLLAEVDEVALVGRLEPRQRLVLRQRQLVLPPAGIQIGERGVHAGVGIETASRPPELGQRLGLFPARNIRSARIDLEPRLAGRDPDQLLVLAEHLVIASGAFQHGDQGGGGSRARSRRGDGAP